MAAGNLKLIALFVVVILRLGQIDAVIPGCTSAVQAETIGEEIAKLFSNANLVDVLTGIFTDAVPAKETVEACANKVTSLRDYESQYKTQAQLLIARANEAEEKVNQGNTIKGQQEDVAMAFLDLWKKIKRTGKRQQKMLTALDIFVKDSVMKKAAEIADNLIKGNTEGWTVDKTKQALMDEMDDVKLVASTLSPALKRVMDIVLPRVMDYYRAHQVDTALANTPLAEALDKDGDIVFKLGFSEIRISRNMRQALNVRYGTMVIGMEEAQEYSEQVNNTLTEARGVHQTLSDITPSMSCNDIKQTVNQAINKLKELFNSLQENELKTATTYLNNVESYGREKIIKILGTTDLTSSLQAVLKTLPDIDQVNGPTSFHIISLFDFSFFGHETKSFPELEKLIKDGYPHLDYLVKVNLCYIKILQVIGKILQGCKDGAGSFHALHKQIKEAANINNRRCYDRAGVELPAKWEIKEIVERAAAKLGFNPKCQLNKQADEPAYKIDLDFVREDDVTDDLESESLKKLSPTQRYMVCDLRTKPKENSEIARLLEVDQVLIDDVRCKPTKSKDRSTKRKAVHFNRYHASLNS